MNVTIVIYYMALLNAVERSVPLHGPSQLLVVIHFFDNSPILSIK